MNGYWSLGMSVHASWACFATLASAAAFAAPGPPDGSTSDQKAVIAADPVYSPQRLGLVENRASPGSRRSLFNGKNLEGWDSWLGAPDPAQTYAPALFQSIGLNNDKTHVFSVVKEDGAPAIFANGKLFGGLITNEAYGNYHLHIEYKWGPHAWIPGFPRNNGILYHSHGQYGAFFGTWMQAVEFEIVPHSVGMLLTVGQSKTPGSFTDVAWNVGAAVPVGHDATLKYPQRRYLLGGRIVPVEFPAYNVEAGTDAEKPIGQWNALDLYVFGDRSIHVVNGVPVMVASQLSAVDSSGKRRALTAGRIQLQSEGAETYFRNITIEPISALPTVVQDKPHDR